MNGPSRVLSSPGLGDLDSVTRGWIENTFLEFKFFQKEPVCSNKNTLCLKHLGNLIEK